MPAKKFTATELTKNESFNNWVEGSSTAEEQHFWDSWVERSERNRRVALQAQQKIVGISLKTLDLPDAKKSWEKIDDQIEENVFRLNLARNKSSRDKQPTAQRTYGAVQFLRYAAIIALVFTGSLTWYFFTDSPSEEFETVSVVERRITTDFSETKRVRLSDGSEIILNSNSELTYLEDLRRNRATDVTLKGEAFFSIADRGKNGANTDVRPFRVFTSDGKVSVMGTRFTVSTLTKSTRVVLEEGEVVVVPLNREELQIFLKPDDLVEFSRFSNEQLIHRVVDSRVYTSWTGSTLYFEQTPVSEIVERIEQRYGVRVVVNNPNILERSITGSVQNKDIDSIVSIIGKTLRIKTSINEEVIYLGEKNH